MYIHIHTHEHIDFGCTDTTVQNNNKFMQSKVTSLQIKDVMHRHVYIIYVCKYLYYTYVHTYKCTLKIKELLINTIIIA